MWAVERRVHRWSGRPRPPGGEQHFNKQSRTPWASAGESGEDPYLTPATRFNFEWIRSRNVRADETRRGKRE